MQQALQGYSPEFDAQHTEELVLANQGPVSRGQSGAG